MPILASGRKWWKRTERPATLQLSSPWPTMFERDDDRPFLPSFLLSLFLRSGPDHGSSGSRGYGYACRTTRHDRRRSDNDNKALP
uniref:Uncharacterized protein n=1 Tax=Echinococcus granulosus TaxID=6210 RepID=A0A068X2K4_ECHGR|nr:hypothetical protein EgrG_002053400 [Echinococcus granulosus]